MGSSNDIVDHDNVDLSSGSGLALMIGFFLSFRVVIPEFCVRILGADPQSGAEAKLVLGLLLLCLVCFASLGSADRTFRSMLTVPSIRWASIYLAVSGCSLLWSINASQVASIAYWCGTISDVLVVILLFRSGSITGTAFSLMKGFVWGSCCIALIGWIMPTQYDLRLGDEDFFNSNTIGNLCAFSLFFVQYLVRRKQGKWTLVALFLGVTLLRSLSKTTIAAFLVAESYLLIQDRSMSRRTKIFLTTTFTVVIIVFWGLFEAYYNLYTTTGNQAETLTGRTAIWTYVLNSAFEHPWVGHGFDSMWNVIPTFGTFQARHAENELLEQFYSYGAVGIVMLCGLYGSLYRRSRRLLQGAPRIIFVSIILFVVVRGFAEAEPFDLLLPLWMIVLIAMLVDCVDTTTQEAIALALPVRSQVSGAG